MQAGRWRLPHGPRLPSSPHIRNTLEGRAGHTSCRAQQNAIAASSLMCWTVPGTFLSPFPCPPSVPGDPSLCPLDDLVEKKPCSWNSTRVCECRTGMFCGTSVVNSCARCLPHSVCPTGMVVKFQGEYPHPGPRSVPMIPPRRPPNDSPPPTSSFLLDRSHLLSR